MSLSDGALAAIRDDLYNSSAVIDNPEAQYSPAALAAMRAAEKLLSEVDELRAELADARVAYDLKVQEFARETLRVSILAARFIARGHSPEGYHAQPGHRNSCDDCAALAKALGPSAPVEENTKNLMVPATPRRIVLGPAAELAAKALHDHYCRVSGDGWHTGNEAMDCVEGFNLAAMKAVEAALPLLREELARELERARVHLTLAKKTDRRLIHELLSMLHGFQVSIVRGQS